MNRTRRQRRSIVSITLLLSATSAYLVTSSLRAVPPGNIDPLPDHRAARSDVDASDRTVVIDSCLRLLTQPISTAASGLFSANCLLDPPGGNRDLDEETKRSPKVSPFRRQLRPSMVLAQNRIPFAAAPLLYSASAQTTAASTNAVGINIRLGDDPPALPPSNRAQAEPHIIRSPTDRNFLVGVFHEGTYATAGGAVDCGYSVSHDGGSTWSRALIPSQTKITGGP